LKSTIICVEKTAVENIHTMSISGHLRWLIFNFKCELAVRWLMERLVVLH
jgi:hypothetical protein